MSDIFEEYGATIIAVVIGALVIGALFMVMKGGFLTEWVNNYVRSVGG